MSRLSQDSLVAFLTFCVSFTTSTIVLVLMDVIRK